MNPATISASTFNLRDASNGLVAASVNYDATSRTATLTPNSALVPSATYTAQVIGGAGGATDSAGNPLSTDVVWSFTTAAPPADDGPGGPILVIGSSANPFGRYYGEILKAEGLNEYRGTDISNVTPAVLSSYHVVILGEMTLTAAQTTMLTRLGHGGRQARRDASGRPTRGPARLTRSRGQCRTHTSTSTRASPRARASRTRRSSTTAPQTSTSCRARRASRCSTASVDCHDVYPAVTSHAVGRAAARQQRSRTTSPGPSCTPARATRRGPVRSATATADPIRRPVLRGRPVDPQPDWVNLDKVAIPQADEQQRLLANLVLQMESSGCRCRDFGTCPRGDKAAVVMTGRRPRQRRHGRPFRRADRRQPGRLRRRGLAVRAQHFVRVPEHATHRRAGRGVHEPRLRGRDARHDRLRRLDAAVTRRTSTAAARSVARRVSESSRPVHESHPLHRNSDYSTQPHVELANGIRLDTNYYYWPPGWIQDRPGLFTGSGMPMRFADPDGSVIDVYQATTQMTDESGQSYPHTIDTLLDNALGPLGYYGVFTANMHTDSATSSGADAIISSAQARNVPVVSARQMLDWVDGRNASSFSAPVMERPRPHLQRHGWRAGQRIASNAADDERRRRCIDLHHAWLVECRVHDPDDQGRVVCSVRQFFGGVHRDLHPRHDAAGDLRRRRNRHAERRRNHHVDDQRGFEFERCVRDERQLAQHHPI